MKRIGALLMLTVMAFGALGCQKEPAPEKITAAYPLDEYILEEYTLPYWSGNIVYHESVMLLEDKLGKVADIPLLYKATQIISVRTSDLKKEYQEGSDYQLVDGKLHIPEGSSIPTVEHSFYYPAQESKTSFPLDPNYLQKGYLFRSEGDALHAMQIAVTYAHEDPFPGTVPQCKADQLPKLKAKLENGEELKIAVYGDSISTGANSTGFVLAAPRAKPWFQMFADKLQEKYPAAKVTLANFSKGDTTSQWGAENAEINIGYGPDLCIIGFGMNDGTKRVEKEDYQKNIKSIIETAQAANPDCQIILMATMLANPEMVKFYGPQATYLPMLEQLETTGVVVADMTTFHQTLMAKKRYCDMTGNNINHPNDFLARAYAQVLWQTAVGY